MARITIPAIGSAGLIRDQQPQELPVSALSDVQNIRLRDGSAERIAGDFEVFTTPAATPYMVGLYATATARFVVRAGLSAVHVDDGSTLTEITGTPPTGGIDDRWTGGVLNGVLIMNNHIDVPTFWGGNVGLNLATLTDWDATWRAYSIRPFRNYLIAMNLTKNTSFFPHMVKWSSAADPGAVPAAWDETDPSTDAGETDLAETPGILVDGLAMNDNFILYKTDAMYAMNYIGGQYIWQFRKLPGDVGALTRGGICNTPSGHLVLTVGDVVIHNGNGPQSILNNRLRRWLFDQIDETYSARSFVVSNPAINEAWICFPEVGADICTKALIWNWADNTFSTRELANVTCGTSGQYEFTSGASWASDPDDWNEDTTTWNSSDIPATQSRFLLGTSGPKLLGIDIGTDFDGAMFNAKVERTGLTFDKADSVKMIKGVYPRIDGATGETVYIQVGGAMDAEGSVTWSDAVAYVIGSTYRADLFMTGRFIAYRIYSTGSFNWRVKSLDFEVEIMGEF